MIAKEKYKMKVLIYACGKETRFAGIHVHREAKRQGLDVDICFSRANPQGLLDALAIQKYDCVLCFVINPKYNKYYQMIRKTGAKLIFWYPDQCCSRRDRMWHQLSGQADAVFFSILHTAQMYSRLFPVTLWMPQYFDHRFCMKDGNLPIRLDPNKEIYDLCFIGSCDKRRQKFLNELSKHYKCKFIVHRPRMLNEIRGYEMAEAYAQSKISFNIQREIFLNPGPFITSNRVYNAMGSGSFFINHYVKEIKRLWQLGTHCDMYEKDDYNDLRYKIDLNLYSYNGRRREQIANLGQENILKYHTLEQRVKEYWAVMSRISNGHTKSLKDNFPAGYGEWVNAK